MNIVTSPLLFSIVVTIIKQQLLVDSFSYSPTTSFTTTAAGNNKSLLDQVSFYRGSAKTCLTVLSSTKKDYETLNLICVKCNEAIENAQPEFIKTCKVEVLPSPVGYRLGLIATENIKKGDVALAMIYDDQICLTPRLATDVVWKAVLPDGYDGWTGDTGLIALLVLNELAKTTSADGKAGIQEPKRNVNAQGLISAWVSALPSPSEMKYLHPISWDEDYQENMQSSSTKKIYRLLDDIDDDSDWLEERVWSKDRNRFPEEVTLNGEVYECFTPKGFAWAASIVSSRSVFVDGTLRLIPFLDMFNHDDAGVQEISGAFMGRFGTTKGAELSAGANRKFRKGKEVFASYGPKSAAEYLLDHGFVSESLSSMSTSVAELTFEMDKEDEFYNDKLDILEFETWESVPMEPTQSFDVVSELGRDGEPDPSMIQFVRFLNLGGQDAFLLESIFRKEVWGFMALPVSERNEREALDTVTDACQKALDDMEVGVAGDIDLLSPVGLCAIVRESERKALSRTLQFLSREKEALDLKEYYQERRLKSMGLDSEWSPEGSGSSDSYDDYDDDLAFGQSRAPGSGLDW